MASAAQVAASKAVEINGMTYNIAAIAGLIVTSVVLVYLMNSFVLQRQRTLEEVRLTHVRRSTGFGLVAFIVLSLVTSIVVMVLQRAGVFDSATFANRWYEKGGSQDWCETVNPESIIKNPANTMSNVAFIIAGVAMIVFGIEDSRALRQARNAEGNPNDKIYEISDSSANVIILRLTSISWLWGGTLLYLGLASGIYHAQLVQFWGYLDVASIYAVLTVPIFYDLLRFLPWNKNPNVSAIAMYIAEGAVILATFILIALERTIPSQYVGYVVGGLIGTDIVLRLIYMFLYPRKSKYNRTGLLRGTMAIGTGVATLVLLLLEPSSDCPEGVNPDSFLQIHAIYHICAAEAIFLSYMITRSETLKKEAVDEKRQELLCADTVDSGVIA